MTAGRYSGLSMTRPGRSPVARRGANRAGHHPSPQQWREYQRSRTSSREAGRMTDHLATCAQCVRVASQWVAVDHYFDRTVPSLFPISPLQVESELRERWIPALRSLAERGGVLCITGSWDMEPLICRLIAVSISRLRASGLRIGAPGLAADPGTATHDAALEVRFTPKPEGEMPRASAVILTEGDGSDVDGALRMSVRHAASAAMTSAWEQIRTEMREALVSEERPVRLAFILCACEAHLPSAYFAGEPPLAFAPLLAPDGETLPIWSVPGVWAAQDLLKRAGADNAGRLKEDLRAVVEEVLPLFPEIRARVERFGRLAEFSALLKP
jgi:hypothetical protein